MSTLWFLSLLLLHLIEQSASAAEARPHIIMILGDDVGWANVGWHRTPNTTGSDEAVTPALNSLVAQGIELNNFRTFKYCSPSRSALQTGRNPIHVNVVNGATDLNNPNDPVSGWTGIPTNMTSLAEKLRSVGYRTHATGKWDVGMATERHTPMGRGYETWLGYFGHCNDYWTEIDKCGMSSCGSTSMVDLWSQNMSRTPASFPGSAHNNSQKCSQKAQDGCDFEDAVFLERAKRVVLEHNISAVDEPLFLFWGIHACHGPRQVPQATYDKFAFIEHPARRMYAALASYMDMMVGELVEELKTRGMYDNTLLVFSSDNGGDDAANNYPLRGAKFSNWEGGIRVPALVSGGVIPPARRGLKLGGLTAIWDLYATFGEVAGMSSKAILEDPAAASAGLPGIDSISQWGYWTGDSATAPRNELAIGGALGSAHGDGNQFLATTVEGLISSEEPSTMWKLLYGYSILEAIWTGPQFPNSSTTPSDWDSSVDCTAGCLYNLTRDPEERQNVAHLFPDKVHQMVKRISELNQTVFSPDRGPKDPRGCRVALSENGGFWGPFATA